VCIKAVLDAVLELRPSAPVVRFTELGHYPQIEEPDVIAEAVTRIADSTT
jgi:hypothetical protein